MPTYIFKDTRTGEVFEKYLGMSELDEFKKHYDHLKQMPTMLNAVGNVGEIKTDDGFKDLMNNIKKNNVGSTMRSF